MKLLLLTDGLFPFQIGGMQKHSSILVKELTKRNICLTVIHPGGKDYSVADLNSEFGINSNTEFIKIDFPILKKIPGHYIRANKIYSKLCFEAIEQRVNEFDIIYAQGFTAHHFLKNDIKQKITVPILINLHGFEMFQFLSGFKMKLGAYLLRQEVRFLVRRADKIYSFGGKISDILKRLNIPEERIINHSNGIQEELVLDTVEDKRSFNFLFIGRNEKRKGYAELIEALILLNDEKMVFHFIGDIPESERLKSTNFHYYGTLSNQQKIISIIDKCSCIIVPSYSEGMPTVILEAMARGLCVIATDVGAVSKMVSGNGILINDSKPMSIMRAINQIKNAQPAEIQSMQKKSIELVKTKFTWSKVIESKINDFKQIIEKKRN